jgi:hypothetical protein
MRVITSCAGCQLLIDPSGTEALFYLSLLWPTKSNMTKKVKKIQVRDEHFFYNLYVLYGGLWIF